MTAGDILKQQLLATTVLTVKSSEDIELGELVCDDGSGNGIIAATAALKADGMIVYMATVAHVYADETDHDIVCVEVGYVEVQKKTGNDIKKGTQVIVSATSGEADIYVAPAVAGSFNQTTLQACLDILNNIIGRCAEDCLNADTVMKILIGVV